MGKFFYSGKFIPNNKHKYIGDINNLWYRSGWELSLFNWLDKNSGVSAWSSEETIIPYTCPVDGKIHRYFPDVLIKFTSGKTFLVELKPHKETMPPKEPTRKTKRYITEVMTWARNSAKWEAASEFAEYNNYKFEVWTEKTLKKLGIPVL